MAPLQPLSPSESGGITGPGLQIRAGKLDNQERGRGTSTETARQEKMSAAGLDMEIDGADGIEATGLAAGSVGDGAVEASAQHGDSRPKKRQRREEEGGAGEALSVRCCLETAYAWWLHHITCGRLHCKRLAIH